MKNLRLGRPKLAAPLQGRELGLCQSIQFASVMKLDVPNVTVDVFWKWRAQVLEKGPCST